jgi:hypothetical protein
MSGSAFSKRPNRGTDTVAHYRSGASSLAREAKCEFPSPSRFNPGTCVERPFAPRKKPLKNRKRAAAGSVAVC